MPRPRSLSPYAFIAFPTAILAAFVLVPTLAGIVLSFFQWGGGAWDTIDFVGLKNYRDLLGSPATGPALINTIVFVIGTVPISVVVAFGLAVLVDAPWFRGKSVARTLLFMPSIVSIVAIGVVWWWLLYAEGGLIPALLRLLGVDPPDFLNGGAVPVIGRIGGADGVTILTWPMLSIIFVQVWRMIGFCLVLYMAALSTVNRNLYEAAEVDGASRWAVVRHITWPQVAPMTAFLFITGVIGALQVFDIVWIMTQGRETDATNVLNLYIYREFTHNRYGYAAAIGVVIFAITLGVTLAQLWWARRKGKD
jgi:multiple sugar transport system permease protein